MEESEVIVGRIVRAHGLRGDLVIYAAAEPELFFRVSAVTVERSGSRQRYEIAQARMQGKVLVLSLDGVVDRNAAEALIGSELIVRRDELPPPAADEVYLKDLIGLPVVSPAGATLGKVVEFEDGGVLGWLVVEANGRQSLVPFTEPLIKVDMEARRIVLDAPEGLLS